MLQSYITEYEKHADPEEMITVGNSTVENRITCRNVGRGMEFHTKVNANNEM